MFNSNDPAIDQMPAGSTNSAAQATRQRQAVLGQRPRYLSASPASPPGDSGRLPAATPGEPANPVQQGHLWMPLRGAMQAFNNPGVNAAYTRRFQHTLSWRSQSDLDAFGKDAGKQIGDYGYEHNLSLYYRSELLSNSTRPACSDSAYTYFWAKWDTAVSRWNAVKYGWNFPAESAPYWDWDDDLDSCQKLDFSVGVGYPTLLKPGISYSYWIAALPGTSSSVYELAGQKLSNDCNNIGMEPGSSCMGLADRREFTGTEYVVRERQAWRVPSCVDWVRFAADSDQKAKENGTAGCPLNS